MAVQKNKYTLTDDIIEIKKEPIQYSDNNNSKKNIKFNANKERLSLNINRDLKTDLHMHCVKNKKAMTDVIEMLITNFLNKGK